MEHGPDVILRGIAQRDVGAGIGLHRGDGGLAGVDGTAHREDLVWALHGAGLFGHFLAFEDLEPLRLERAEPVQHQLVGGKPHVAGGMFGHQHPHLVREGIGGHVHLVAPVEVEQVGAGALFAHQRVEGREER